MMNNLPEPTTTEIPIPSAPTGRKPRHAPISAALAAALRALRRAGYGEGEILDAMAEVLEAGEFPSTSPRTVRAEVSFVLPPISEAERAARKAAWLAEHSVTKLPAGFADGVGHIALALANKERKTKPPRTTKTPEEIAALLADLQLDL